MIDFDKNTISLDYFQKIIKEIKNNESIYLDIIDSVSPNQFKSKTRLFDLLNKLNILDSDLNVVIFGGWYGSILIPYLSPKVKYVTTIDKDDMSNRIAKNRFFANLKNVDFITDDVFGIFRKNYSETKLFINTSCEHMLPMKEWPHWGKVKSGTYVAFQSNSMSNIEDHVNCVNSIEEFKNQLPINCNILLTDELVDDRGKRFTIIGQIFNQNNVLGFFNESDQLNAAYLAKQVPENGTIVEIGSLMGKSSVTWAKFSKPSVNIYCIDVFPDFFKARESTFYETNIHPDPNVIYNVYEEFLKNTKNYSNIKMIQGFSPNEFSESNLQTFNSIKEIDLFFLDASHKNPNDWDNIMFFLPKIKSGGIICGHDYNHPEYPDVEINVKKLEEILKTKVSLYSNSSLWSFKIP